MTRGKQRGLQVVGYPANARRTWEHLTRLVREGAPEPAVKAARAAFCDALEPYTRSTRV